jgi:hypothetical protein
MFRGCRDSALYTSVEGIGFNRFHPLGIVEDREATPTVELPEATLAWRAIDNGPKPNYALARRNPLPLTSEVVMNEDRFNIEVRQFLKQVGITSQREIERAVRDALASGQIKGSEKLKVTARIQIEGVALDHKVEGEIALS